ncbi:MAG TPA: hypothetical protein VHP83_26355 [Aggregatilineaceae bacterium]|nr:hypothetical protein [Aggregatilineaceae bacterium]
MSADHPRDRPPRELLACSVALMFAQGASPADINQTYLVRPTTLEKWLANDDFRQIVSLLRQAQAANNAVDALDDLTLDALDALRRALTGPSVQWAVLAARDVLDRIERIAEQKAAAQSQTAPIRVEYINPERKPYTAPFWTEGHPDAPEALQSGSLRETLREDGTGQDRLD